MYAELNNHKLAITTTMPKHNTESLPEIIIRHTPFGPVGQFLSLATGLFYHIIS